MEIRFAGEMDLTYLIANDRHVTPETVREKVMRGEIIVVSDGRELLGWLRFGYFWDVIPFINMLAIEAPFRRQGIGRRLVLFWEASMRDRQHGRVMTSTQSNEEAQHFYRKLGYRECGALILDPEPLEILFVKTLAETGVK
ncbi:MAG: GNAT family N-acetyltransferase [Caldilineaceae bacterium]|nr:GNAT family N-acetyltransferase [Caldilineaceae bacterium]